MTLAEFLLARIADDEVAARQAMAGFPSGEWVHDGSIYARHPVNEVVDWVYNDAADHIARHDPARELAECEAKRRIVSLADWTGEKDSIRDRIFGPSADLAFQKGIEAAMRSLAAVYADHSDYREEWMA